MRRILVSLMALLMILSVLSSCGSADTPAPAEKGSETVRETDKPAGTETDGPETEAPAHKPDIPETDRNTTLQVAHWTVDETWIPWEEICVYDYSGDNLGDAVYERTAELKEKFGITLESEYVYVSDITHKVDNMIKTGTDEYQLIVQRSFQMQYHMMEDVFANLGALPYVDLKQPYWSQVSVKAFTFGGSTLFAASDMLLLDKSSTAAIAYNTSIARDHSWDGSYFYDLVNSRSWTLEKLTASASQAYLDLDGDTVVSTGDVFGAQGGDSPVHFLFNGSGELFCRNTGDDRYMEYTFGTERSYNVVMDTLEDLVFQDWYLYDRSTVENAFANNQVFFDITRIESLNKYRAMEQDYGILPIPMYDEAQAEYYSEISPHHDSVIAVPHTAITSETQEEAVGAALEELAYISSRIVYPVLYDVVISGKGTRDQESKDMLKIIFDSRIYDLGIIYDFGQFADKVLRMPRTGKSDIVSPFEETRDKIETQLDEVVTRMHEIFG